MAPPFGYSGPGYPPSSLQSRPDGQADSGPRIFGFAGMRLSQQRSDEAYTLDIELNGLDPEQVRVMPSGYTLAIVADRSAQTSSTETFDDGRGFRRSYSWSGGQGMRRLPVPPDGDLSGMQREDGDGMIHIVIPRIAAAAPPDPARHPAPDPAGPPQSDQETEQQ
ncbi:MAG: Hsp20/alpha crystallin family protein [Thiohalocapsa sp.]